MNQREIKAAVINNQTNVPVRTSGYAISLCGIIGLSVMVYFMNSAAIKKPVILFLGAFFCLFNLKNTSTLTSMQKVLLIYLILTSFNQLSTNTMGFTSGQTSVILPVNLVPMLLLVIGFILSKTERLYPLTVPQDKNLLVGWTVGFGVIVLHMLFLVPLLMKFYCYGYEHNLYVIVLMCLYFSLFIILSSLLESIRFRQITAVVFVILYLCLFVFNG